MEKILTSQSLIINMKKTSQELARIHAHLCGDWFTCMYKTRRKDRKNIAIVGYCNKNQRLLDNFRKDFNKLFSVKMKMRKNREGSISSIRIYKEITENFGKFGSREWKIPVIIKNSSKKIKVEWLKSFLKMKHIMKKDIID